MMSRSGVENKCAHGYNHWANCPDCKDRGGPMPEQMKQVYSVNRFLRAEIKCLEEKNERLEIRLAQYENDPPPVTEADFAWARQAIDELELEIKGLELLGADASKDRTYEDNALRILSSCNDMSREEILEEVVELEKAEVMRRMEPLLKAYWSDYCHKIWHGDPNAVDAFPGLDDEITRQANRAYNRTTHGIDSDDEL